MKRKRHQATGTESLRFGQWPFADGVESADAADAARYRYLTSGRCELSFFLRLCALPKAQWGTAIDVKMEELK